jgi:hypothetical protein
MWLKCSYELRISHKKKPDSPLDPHRSFCNESGVNKHHEDTAQSVAPSIVLTEKEASCYWGKIRKDESCWIWTGCRDTSGYGLTTFRGRCQGVHRLSWRIHRGEIPKEMCVCHGCDEPLCVNPAHLWLGTRKQNTQDRDRKQRNNQPRGSSNGNSKLVAGQVDSIRKMAKAGLTKRQISDIIGTSFANVSHILHGKTWKWLPH